MKFSFAGAPLFFHRSNCRRTLAGYQGNPGPGNGRFLAYLACVSSGPLPSSYDEPTVMWRMRRPDGLAAHVVIGFQGPRAWVIWFLNDRPIGLRDFENWTSAIQWTDRMQAQNWTVGWRDTSLSTDREG